MSPQEINPGRAAKASPPSRRGEIFVSLDLDGPELAGRMRIGEGEEEPFVSWLGLISALASAAEILARADDSPSSRPA